MKLRVLVYVKDIQNPLQFFIGQSANVKEEIEKILAGKIHFDAEAKTAHWIKPDHIFFISISPFQVKELKEEE